MVPGKARALGLVVLISALVAMTSGCAAFLRQTRAPSGGRLYVVNALNQTITVVDPADKSVLKTTLLNSVSPHDITYLPKHGKVYVVNTAFQQVSVLDAKSGNWLKNLMTLPRPEKGHEGVPMSRSCNECHRDPVGGMPVNLTSSLDERYLYVANVHAKKVSVIDTEQEELVDTISTDEAALGLAIVGNDLWVSNRHKGSVSVMDMTSRKTVDVISVGTMPGFILARPSHNEVYVCVAGEAKILVFDAKDRKVKHEIQTQLGTRALAFNEARGVGYAANYYSDSVTEFDLATGKVLKTKAFKLNPDDVALSGDGSELYITCTGTGELVVVDAETLDERRRFAAGPYPADMVLVP